MPFGLTSAPNTWARLVTQVLQEILKTKLIVFFDDLLIHSPDLKIHMETVKQVFYSSTQSWITTKYGKNRLGQNSGQILGPFDF